VQSDKGEQQLLHLRIQLTALAPSSRELHGCLQGGGEDAAACGAADRLPELRQRPCHEALVAQRRVGPVMLGQLVLLQVRERCAGHGGNGNGVSEITVGQRCNLDAPAAPRILLGCISVQCSVLFCSCARLSTIRFN
jgi:hypothetical protein